jgi:HEPN domain-containing protein
MSAELLIANSLRIASEDLAGARLLAAAGNRNSIYLLEQAAEKIIRAVMTSEGIHAGIRHDLPAIVDRVPDENPIKAGLRAVEHLAAYATTYRYPTASARIEAAPSAAEIASHADAVEKLLLDVASRLGVDLASTGTPARSARPIR